MAAKTHREQVKANTQGWLEEAQARLDAARESYEAARQEEKQARRLAEIVFGTPSKNGKAKHGAPGSTKITWRDDGSVKAGMSSISAERVQDLIDTINDSDEPLSATEIIEETAINSSSGHIGIRALREAGKIRVTGVDPDTRAKLYAPMRRTRRRK